MTSDPRSQLTSVAIRGFPLEVYLASQQHSEALLREFAFIVKGGGDQSELPKRLLDVVDAVQERLAGLNTHVERILEEAVARGDAEVEFEIVVPRRLARGVDDFAALLDEVDDYCRAGELLTLATPPRVRAFREWYLGEFTRQLGGAEPTTWQAWNDSRGEGATRS
jgi:hypothetical protein